MANPWFIQPVHNFALSEMKYPWFLNDWDEVQTVCLKITFRTWMISLFRTLFYCPPTWQMHSMQILHASKLLSKSTWSADFPREFIVAFFVVLSLSFGIVFTWLLVLLQILFQWQFFNSFCNSAEEKALKCVTILLPPLPSYHRAHPPNKVPRVSYFSNALWEVCLFSKDLFS